MKNRKLSLLLVLLMLASAVSCGGAASGDDTTAASGDTTTAPVSENPLDDDLPAKDFGGHVFTVCHTEASWLNTSWTAETETGDTLNDAIYKRNLAVSDRFNVTIAEYVTESNDSASNSILAGDDTFDIYQYNCGKIITLAQEGYIVDTAELTYCDYSKPYWDQNLNDAITIAGKRFFSVGALDLTEYDYTHVLLFNKKVLEDNNLDAPYSLVSDGKWTFAEYGKLSKNVTADVNGDTVMDGKDRYGLLSQAKHVLPDFWIAADVKSVNTDENGNPVFNMPTDAKFTEVFEQIFALTYDNNSWFSNTEVRNDSNVLEDMFQNNQGLFHDSTFFYISNLRNMETDFGIIPFPKYDEAQENYRSRVEGANLIGVPVTADIERTSIILEALASESAKQVIPAYYEVALKSKYARDPESMDMLDIIFENRVFDLGDTIWCGDVRDGVFAGMFGSNDRNLASKTASMKSTIDAKIDALIKAFSE